MAARKRAADPGRRARARSKTAKARKASSTRWLQRQRADAYVAEAKARGYRSRAAFKLIELDDRFRLLKPGARVLDLGAAPGSWTQVAADRVKAGKPGGGRVVAVDRDEMAAVPGATVLCRDALGADAPAALLEAIGGPVDVVLSDMAAPTTGHRPTDHLRLMALSGAAFELACRVLRPGGAFIAKALQGGTEQELIGAVAKRFRVVRQAKPRASRSQSAEFYVVALGYRRGARQQRSKGS